MADEKLLTPEYEGVLKEEGFTPWQIDILKSKYGGVLTPDNLQEVYALPTPSVGESFAQGAKEGAITGVGGTIGAGIGTGLAYAARNVPYVKTMSPITDRALPAIGGLMGSVLTGSDLNNDSYLNFNANLADIPKAILNPDNIVDTGVSVAGGILGSVGGPLGSAFGAAALPMANRALTNYLFNKEETPQEQARGWGQAIGGFGFDATRLGVERGGKAVSNYMKGVLPNEAEIRARDMSYRTSGERVEDPDFGLNQEIATSLGAADRTSATSQGEVQQGATRGFARVLSDYKITDKLRTSYGDNKPQAYRSLPKELQSTIKDVVDVRDSLVKKYADYLPSAFEIEQLSPLDSLADRLAAEKGMNADPSMHYLYEAADEVINNVKNDLINSQTVGDLIGRLDNIDASLKRSGAYNNSKWDAARAKNNQFVPDITIQIQETLRDIYGDAIKDSLNNGKTNSDIFVGSKLIPAGVRLGDLYSQLGQDASALIRLKQQATKSNTQTTGASGVGVDPRKLAQGPMGTPKSISPEDMTVTGATFSLINAVSQGGLEKVRSARAAQNVLETRPTKIIDSIFNAVDQYRNGNKPIPQPNIPSLMPSMQALSPLRQFGLPQMDDGTKFAYADNREMNLSSSIPAGVNQVTPNIYGVPEEIRMQNQASQLTAMKQQIQATPATPPGALNTIISTLAPERDFSRGLPRTSGEWDPKAITQFFASTVGQQDGRSEIAKELGQKLLSASQQGDDRRKKEILTDMTRIFPDLFEPGMGIDNSLLHPEDQARYTDTLRSGLYNQTVGPEQMYRQVMNFALPGNGAIVPYAAPKDRNLRNGAFLGGGGGVKLKKKVSYDY